MNLLKNLKDPITDIIGLVIICFTLLEVYVGHITWLWEGYAGMGIGLILFMFPDELIVDILKNVSNKMTGK